MYSNPNMKVKNLGDGEMTLIRFCDRFTVRVHRNSDDSYHDVVVCEHDLFPHDVDALREARFWFNYFIEMCMDAEDILTDYYGLGREDD